jgi:hypothetical protein
MKISVQPSKNLHSLYIKPLNEGIKKKMSVFPAAKPSADNTRNQTTTNTCCNKLHNLTLAAGASIHIKDVPEHEMYLLWRR